MTSIEEIKKRKGVCPICHKELFLLGMGRHRSMHKMEEMKANKPKYTEKDFESALLNQRKEIIQERMEDFKDRFCYEDLGPDADGYDAKPITWNSDFRSLNSEEQVEKMIDWLSLTQETKKE